MKHTRKWFKVGKTIYRNKIGECCDMCKNPAKITIKDEEQAEHLFTCHLELGINYYEK